MQGSEPKPPSDGAPQSDEGQRDVVTEPADGAALAETPQTASASMASLPAEKDRGGRKKSPSRRTVLAIAGSAAALLGVAAVPIVALKGGEPGPVPAVSAAEMAASAAELEVVIDSGPPAPASSSEAAPSPPKTWRVADMADDAQVAIVDVTLGHKSLLSALAAAQLPSAEAQRVSRSLAAVRDVDRFGAQDAVSLALDKGTQHVLAYELVSSPSDVWQAREQADAGEAPALLARKLDLVVTKVRVGKSILVGTDLRTALSESGLTPVDEILSLLDDALEGHAELSDVRPGARFRFLGTQEQVEGTFVRWVSLDAVEYFPAAPNANPVRVYAVTDDAKHPRGEWYDAKGKQPVRGGWRSPVPFARIASRFNLHRMHPVLHVIMPHNGVDFAAPVGTPVYATATGTVTSAGNGGPCGNMIEIAHAGGITSVYCHLSRFAPGIRAGVKVEQRQLIAYVGQTGRVTGPHLHFGIRRNGVFIDPMTLRLDGVRVLPRADREEFDRRRVELDKELDGIPLPASAGAPMEVSEPDTIYEVP